MKSNRVKGWKMGSLRLGKRTVALLVCVVAGVVFIYSSYRGCHMSPLLPVQRVVFSDNKHLTHEELSQIAGTRVSQSLLTISCTEISRHMLQSPWIKTASVRKELPATLSISIQETEPFALLDMNEQLFLIDERGTFLEELQDDAVPFLPVIVSDPHREREGFTEALNLIKLMNIKGLTSGRNHVEIVAHKPNEVFIVIDDVHVKIGTGEYAEKLERFIQLEEEIRHRNIGVDYVDLRFRDKAIVKPLAYKRTGE